MPSIPFTLYEAPQAMGEPTPSSLREQADWLTERGARRMRHSGRTFIEHLAGTRSYLLQFQEPPAVLAAGLFHSVYGTSQFSAAMLNASNGNDRVALRKLIGAQAEEIAMMFCQIDSRPAQLSNVALGQPRVRLRNGIDIDLRPDLASALLAIECANLLDQRELSELPGLVYHAQGRGYLGPNGFSLARRLSLEDQIEREESLAAAARASAAEAP
jgi:hypothetical protein